MYFVGFYSVSNLIVIIFNLLYPIFIVGLDCKGCVLERKSVKIQAIEGRRVLASSSWLNIPRSEACALHMTGMRRVCTNGDSYVSQVSRGLGLPARHPWNILFCQIVLSDTYFLYLHYIYTQITHKWWGVLLRENPSLKPWELEIIIPIYLYTYACGFP